MTKKYRVVLLGLLGDKEDFELEMSKFGVSPGTIEQIIHKVPVVLKGDMTLRDARQYADTVQYAGGRVNIQEHGRFKEPERINRPLSIKPLEQFAMCPECGFKQLKTAACVKCGTLFIDEVM